MATLLSLIQSVPIVDKWVERFVTFYVTSMIGSMKSDNRNGIRKAMDEQDQRDLEHAIGSPTAGEPSNLPGVEHRDTLPGVH